MNDIMCYVLLLSKVLKLYAWEPFFEEQVHEIRREEMKFLRTEAFLNSLSSFIWFIAPFLVSFQFSWQNHSWGIEVNENCRF